MLFVRYIQCCSCSVFTVCATCNVISPVKYVLYFYIVGRDGSVAIATRYGLGSPGIESRRRRDFPHPSRPALGPTQRPVQWVLISFPGLKRPERVFDHTPTSSAEVKGRRELYLYSHLWARVACYRVTFTFIFYLSTPCSICAVPNKAVFFAVPSFSCFPRYVAQVQCE